MSTLVPGPTRQPGPVPRRAGDREARSRTVRAVARAVSAPAGAFLLARTLLLPLDRFDARLPAAGAFADVGCGHGLLSQYLARRQPARRVIGYDLDPRRLEAAGRAAGDLSNVEFRAERFEASGARDLAGVLLVGILCLVDDAACAGLLAAARRALAPGGALLLHDVRLERGGWVLRGHLWRERLLARSGFTRADGLFVRPGAWWQGAVAGAGFSAIEPFRADVPLHSVFNWICRA